MGHAMDCAMAAVPCSIERHSTLCYGLTSHGCYACMGVGGAWVWHRHSIERYIAPLPVPTCTGL